MPDSTFRQRMWLVLDIGNSAVKGALYSGDTLEHTFRSTHDPASLGPILLSEIESSSLERAGYASVVPMTSGVVSRLFENGGIPVTRIRHSMRLPFTLAYKTPETLGTDRIAAAAAAWLRYGRDAERSVVALDAGSAFTYEVVRRDGVYLGGSIAPGPGLMQRALNRDTAQLPEVPLVLPEAPIGRSTTEAIQVGIMYGFIESARGLLKRINESLDENALVVVTGGWASMLAQNVDEVDAVDPHLVLEGIRLLMEMNG